MSLAHRFRGSDAELAAVLSISRSMLWRLKNKKIQKLDRYIRALEVHLGAGEPEPLDRILDDLRLWSSESAEVRDVLHSLHKVLRDPATS